MKMQVYNPTNKSIAVNVNGEELLFVSKAALILDPVIGSMVQEMLPVLECVELEEAKEQKVGEAKEVKKAKTKKVTKKK